MKLYLQRWVAAILVIFIAVTVHTLSLPVFKLSSFIITLSIWIGMLYTFVAFFHYPVAIRDKEAFNIAFNILVLEYKKCKDNLHDAEQEYEKLATKYNNLVDEFSNIVNYARKLEAEQRNNNNNTVVTVPEDILKAAIRLCHPDKHSNSKSSNDVTAFLITYKKEYF